jgi:hypothetical protein
VQEGRGWSIEDRLPDAHDRGPDAETAAAEERRRVREAVAVLGGRKALVLRLRFGLGGEGPLTLAEIGKRLGVTRERVRRIEKQALAELAYRVGPDGPHAKRGGQQSRGPYCGRQGRRPLRRPSASLGLAREVVAPPRPAAQAPSGAPGEIE